MFTQHAQQRIQQRHLDPQVIDLVLKYGTALSENQDRLLLHQEDLPHIHKYEETLSDKVYSRAEKQLPLVCVCKEGRIVTVFRPYKRINKKRH